MADFPTSIAELAPGTVIGFGDITELPAFEDMIASEIDPRITNIYRDAWAGRTAIRELVRPAKFNGRIGDIMLTVMNEPYERLCDANERGIRFTRGKGGGTGGSQSRLTENLDVLVPQYKGFIFTASAYSSGRGLIGQVQTEAYYFPTHFTNRPDKSDGSPGGRSLALNKSAGSSVRRVVAKPVIASEGAFIELNEASRCIAYDVLRKSLRNAKPQPFHN